MNVCAGYETFKTYRFGQLCVTNRVLLMCSCVRECYNTHTKVENNNPYSNSSSDEEYYLYGYTLQVHVHYQ